MVESFIRGDDRSIRFANRIEEYASTHFRGSEAAEELIEALATYRPGGGTFLLDEDGLRRQLEYALRTWLSHD
jgi:hypothetical protein